jgi:catechol 2,3-dioxygenase-like lactoylglutathione lyase family enzyme
MEEQEVQAVKVHRIDHVGIIVKDLAAAKAFFLDFGLELLGEGEVEGAWLDKIVGLTNVKNTVAMFRTPDGGANIELIQFHTPAGEGPAQQQPANTPGIRHIAFVVEDIEAHVARLKKQGIEVFSEIQHYQDSYKLIYIRGPEGIILELAEPIQ